MGDFKGNFNNVFPTDGSIAFDTATAAGFFQEPVTAAILAASPGPTIDGVTTYVDEFDAVFRWHLGDATAADGYRVLSHTGGSAGRWIRISNTGGVRDGTVIAPAAITGAVNDYNPTGLATAREIQQDLSASATLSSVVAQAAGTRLRIRNITTNSARVLTVLHDDGATGTAANRFKLPAGTSIKIDIGGFLDVHYDATASRWMLDAKDTATHERPHTFDGLVTENAGVVLAAGKMQVAIGAAMTFVSGGTTTDDATIAERTLTLTAETTKIGNPANIAAGLWWTREIIQGGAGLYAVTWDTMYDWGSEGAPNIAAYAAGKSMLCTFHATSATKIKCTAFLGFTP